MKDQNDGRHRSANTPDHSRTPVRATTRTARGTKTRTITYGPNTYTIYGPHTYTITHEDTGESASVGTTTVGRIQWMGWPGLRYPVMDVRTIPMEFKTEDVVAGELIGWRAWAYDKGTGCLTSLVFSHTWIPGQPMHGPHNGECFGPGIHANKTKGQLKKNYRHSFSLASVLTDSLARELYGYPLLYGQVALWGDIMEHECGYRAEYAKPISLYWASPAQYLYSSQRKLLRDLRQKYLSKA